MVMLDMRTLVLDDDAAVVDALVASLHETVRQIDPAVDCERALELFATYRHSVVVLDFKMPKMDGFEVMKRIHRLEPQTQVIMVTGYPSIECAKEAVNQHAFGFLIKPFDPRELRRLVVEAFTDYQKRAPHPTPATPDERNEAAIEAEIATLYQQVANASSALEQSPDDPELQATLRESFVQLRSAQAQEAELASRAFRDNLALKNGMGYSSIEAARRVLDRDKDSA